MDASRFELFLSRLEARGTEAALDVICNHFVDEFDVAGASIALIIGDLPRGCLAWSDDRSRQLEDLQFGLGEGPCIEAHLAGSVVSEADLSRSSRWPAFAEGAVAIDVLAVCALPLRFGRAGFGAIDLYRPDAGGFDSRVEAEGRVLADITSAIVLAGQAAVPDGDLTTLIADLVEQRSVVHQATGMVSVQLGVDLADALLALRARAFRTDRNLRSLSLDVVRGRTRFSPGRG